MESVLTPIVTEKRGFREQDVSAILLDPCKGLLSLILDLFPSFPSNPSAAPWRGYYP